VVALAAAAVDMPTDSERKEGRMLVASSMRMRQVSNPVTSQKRGERKKVMVAEKRVMGGGVVVLI